MWILIVQICIAVTGISMSFMFAVWCIMESVICLQRTRSMFHVKHKEHVKGIDEMTKEELMASMDFLIKGEGYDNNSNNIHSI